MFEKKKVLVVCRTSAGRMYLGVLLNRICYMPIFAATTSEGVRLANKHALSVILLDADLPDDNLKAAISLLKNDTAVKRLPLIVILTEENGGTYESLIAEGCSAVIKKPLDFSLFYGVLCRLSGEPRQTPRVAVRMRVEIAEQVPRKYLTSVNISEGGIYLRTFDVVQELTRLHLSFTLPLDLHTIKAAGEVVRKIPLGPQFDTDPGIGLRFVELSEDAKNSIKNFVNWTVMGDLEWDMNFQAEGTI